jgi:hypothetical protein
LGKVPSAGAVYGVPSMLRIWRDIYEGEKGTKRDNQPV